MTGIVISAQSHQKFSGRGEVDVRKVLLGNFPIATYITTDIYDRDGR